MDTVTTFNLKKADNGYILTHPTTTGGSVRVFEDERFSRSLLEALTDPIADEIEQAGEINIKLTISSLK